MMKHIQLHIFFCQSLIKIIRTCFIYNRNAKIPNTPNKKNPTSHICRKQKNR
ncbi:unknown [Prevotella sp. CAG:617]|nr:unknown [Prevotella sp. CAG:617]